MKTQQNKQTNQLTNKLFLTCGRGGGGGGGGGGGEGRGGGGLTWYWGSRSKVPKVAINRANSV